VPPHNFEAEKALLGAIMANNRANEKVSDFLRPHHFADPIHSAVYEAMCKTIEQGQVVTPISLSNFFESQNELVGIGGNEYLERLP